VFGQMVTVTIDRPLGSVHPEYPDLYYPVNYGYLQGTLAADGEEEDVYLLGVDVPVSEFTGRVIAVVIREDDVEHKWVVAPEGACFTKRQIEEKIRFQERFFKSAVYDHQDLEEMP